MYRMDKPEHSIASLGPFSKKSIRDRNGMRKGVVDMQKITPHLWFDKEAKEAAEFYASVFPKSKIKDTATLITLLLVR